MLVDIMQEQSGPKQLNEEGKHPKNGFHEPSKKNWSTTSQEDLDIFWIYLIPN